MEIENPRNGGAASEAPLSNRDDDVDFKAFKKMLTVAGVNEHMATVITSLMEGQLSDADTRFNVEVFEGKVKITSNNVGGEMNKYLWCFLDLIQKATEAVEDEDDEIENDEEGDLEDEEFGAGDERGRRSRWEDVSDWANGDDDDNTIPPEGEISWK